MNQFLLSLLCLLSFGCSSPQTQRKVANYVEQEGKVLSAESLFLKGNVGFKKRKLHPFDENHFGKELDLSVRRPAVNLTGTVWGNKFAKPGFTVYGNFQHHDKFWIARVPDQGVNRVFMHIAYFAPIVMKKYLGGHTYLRFEMKPDAPIEIVAAMPTEDELSANSISTDLELSPSDRLIYNIGLTTEAQWIKEDKKKKYDFLRGKNGAFTQITRFISIHQRLWNFLSNGDPVKQVEFKIENPDNVLKVGLEKSEKDALNVRYDTLGQNCTTTAFDIIEEGSGVRDRRFQPIRKWLQKRIPTLVVPKTRVYGGTAPIPTISDETLRREWKEVYEWEIVQNHREICGPDIIPAHCENSKNAIKEITSW